jgi:uncharacterized protein YeaO (DUF488 family)
MKKVAAKTKKVARKPKHLLQVKRVYASASAVDGLRVLVDRLWPRGISKEKAKIHSWMKDVAPSDALRKRFHGHPEQWQDFKTAYAKELAQDPAHTCLEELRKQLDKSTVTLLYAARDEEHNNAVALKELLLRKK